MRNCIISTCSDTSVSWYYMNRILMSAHIRVLKCSNKLFFLLGSLQWKHLSHWYSITDIMSNIVPTTMNHHNHIWSVGTIEWLCYGCERVHVKALISAFPMVYKTSYVVKQVVFKTWKQWLCLCKHGETDPMTYVATEFVSELLLHTSLGPFQCFGVFLAL